MTYPHAPVLYYRYPGREHDPSTLAPEHPDVPARIDAIQAAMAQAGWPGCELREAAAATENELALVHSIEHIHSIRELSGAGGGRIDDDTFVTGLSYGAALHAAGAACAMARALVGGEAAAGFCATRPAGHHAERDRAMGFCLFNNVAIAAELVIRELGVDRILILDWDVHHGNGTAETFRRRADVLFASIHQVGLFPGTGLVGDAGSGEGLGYTINAPVPKGSDEEVWVSVLEHVIIPAALEFKPQLVLISLALTPIATIHSVTVSSIRSHSRSWHATYATWPARSGRQSAQSSRAAMNRTPLQAALSRQSRPWTAPEKPNRSLPTQS